MTWSPPCVSGGGTGCGGGISTGSGSYLINSVSSKFGIAIIYHVEDQYGNIVTSDNSNVTIAAASGTGSPIGTLTVAASSGVATFSNLSLHIAGAHTLRVTDGSLTTATSNSITITPAAALALTITQGPTNSAAGTLTTMTVAVEDQYGNVVASDNSNVTAAIFDGSGTLSGTTTVAASSGVATGPGDQVLLRQYVLTV